MIYLKYSIGEFADKTGLSIDTLRYYEKEELIIAKRDNNNRRIYDDIDVIWIEFILRLKETNMPIRLIREYSILRYQGDSTVKERMNLLKAHMNQILEDKRKIEENIHHLQNKINIYQKKLYDL